MERRTGCITKYDGMSKQLGAMWRCETGFDFGAWCCRQMAVPPLPWTWSGWGYRTPFMDKACFPSHSRDICWWGATLTKYCFTAMCGQQQTLKGSDLVIFRCELGSARYFTPRQPADWSPSTQKAGCCYYDHFYFVTRAMIFLRLLLLRLLLRRISFLWLLLLPVLFLLLFLSFILLWRFFHVFSS